MSEIHAAIRVHETTLQAVAGFLGLHYSAMSVIAKRGPPLPTKLVA
jgi:hypothetical protein